MAKKNQQSTTGHIPATPESGKPAHRAPKIPPQMLALGCGLEYMDQAITTISDIGILDWVEANLQRQLETLGNMKRSLPQGDQWQNRIMELVDKTIDAHLSA